MSIYTLKNQELTIQICSLGAELKSMKDNKSGIEYMWQADPAYWKRTSPVLFPVVGAYKNNETVYNGKVYHLPQHGFARDMEFILLSKNDTNIWFVLEDNPETRQNYPFAFRLEIGYSLKGREVEVIWRVENPSNEIMYFSIGGHPAFCCPIHNGEQQTEYAIQFDSTDSIISRRLGKAGVTDERVTYPLIDGKLKITEDLFDHDALIIEDNQAQKVSLLNPAGEVYLTLNFDAPLFGIWSPPGKKAPFICIEPWYGRADHEHFTGELEKREWGNCLAPGDKFIASYFIMV